MVHRETNPEIANRIANSPGVGEYLRPDGLPIDLTHIAENSPTRTGCVLVSNGEDALGLFDATATGIYQAHVAFAETCRGKKAVETGREMLDWMFQRGAQIIWCDIPTWHKRAIWFARQLGFHLLPTSDEDTAVLELRRAA